MLEGIILAGGFGTRLRKVVPDLPKPMAPVAGRPFLDILLTSLARKGFTRIVLSLGFMSEKIVNHFGNEFEGVELIYVVEDRPLGTGGAVRLAMTRCERDHVFVFNGDTYLNLEVDAVERQWQQNRSTIIVGRKVSDTLRYGRLLIHEGKVKGFLEKGVAGEGVINAGCYVLQMGSLENYPLSAPFSLEADYFAKIANTDPFDLFVTLNDFIDIGVPEDYARAQHVLADVLKFS